jgi:DICT domain-containing protein
MTDLLEYYKACFTAKSHLLISEDTVTTSVTEELPLVILKF